MVEEQSEFGSGIVVCLAKFSEHLSSTIWFNEDVKRITLKVHDTEEKALSHQIEMWMNGASDHFYDLDRSKAPKPLIELADLTLRIGHGFTNEIWTNQTIDEIRRLWKESCLEVDAMLGVQSDWGIW